MVLSIVPLAAWIGLGVHRHAPPGAIVGAAALVVYGPALMVGAVAGGRHRMEVAAGALLGWTAVLFIVFPVYFPGERREAVATGVGLVAGDRLAQWIVPKLPEEPTVADPEVAEAARAEVTALPPDQTPVGDDQIVLPYEGEGRRMSVPVSFGNAGRERELEMMFDTGATYTTLSTSDLERLGAAPTEQDPVIVLHTANGERQAKVVLVDHVWLGDLRIDGVAVAVCDDCGGPDVAGLLGLNVSGRFNLTIDADRREVVFTRRENEDRKLDIKPFVDLSATFTRFPGGRVEVTVRLANRASRMISSAVASVRCGRERWSVQLGPIEPSTRSEARRKLPEHDACDEYEISMASAGW